MSDTLNPTRDDFSALLDEQLQGRDFGEGQVVHGRVVGIEKDIVIIDVGLKTEGRIAMREFGQGDAGNAGDPPLEAADGAWRRYRVRGHAGRHRPAR